MKCPPSSRRFSAITDDPKYMVEARCSSPYEKNWSWVPSVKDSVRHIGNPMAAPLHDLVGSKAIYEKVEADDDILPVLWDETRKEWTEHEPEEHPIIAKNGPEMMAEFGFHEDPSGPPGLVVLE